MSKSKNEVLTKDQLKEHIKYFPLSTEDKFDKYIKKFYKLSDQQLKAIKVITSKIREFYVENTMYCVTHEELENLKIIKDQIESVHNDYYYNYFNIFKEQILIKMKTPYTLYTHDNGYNILFKDDKNVLYGVTLVERYEDFECYKLNEDMDTGAKASDYRIFDTKYNLDKNEISIFYDRNDFDYENQITKKGYYFALVKLSKNNKNIYYTNIIHYDGKDLKMGNQIISKDSVMSWTELFKK